MKNPDVFFSFCHVQTNATNIITNTVELFLKGRVKFVAFFIFKLKLTLRVCVEMR